MSDLPIDPPEPDPASLGAALLMVDLQEAVAEAAGQIAALTGALSGFRVATPASPGAPSAASPPQPAPQPAPDMAAQVPTAPDAPAVIGAWPAVLPSGSASGPWMPPSEGLPVAPPPRPPGLDAAPSTGGAPLLAMSPVAEGASSWLPDARPAPVGSAPEAAAPSDFWEAGPTAAPGAAVSDPAAAAASVAIHSSPTQVTAPASAPRAAWPSAALGGEVAPPSAAAPDVWVQPAPASASDAREAISVAPVDGGGPPPAAGASPTAIASAVPPPRESHGQAGGDVFLDGMRVGRWLADTLAREAGGPALGSTGFDPRMGPTWAGALQGNGT